MSWQSGREPGRNGEYEDSAGVGEGQTVPTRENGVERLRSQLSRALAIAQEANDECKKWAELFEAERARALEAESTLDRWVDGELAKSYVKLRERAERAEAALREIAEAVDVYRDDEWRDVIDEVVRVVRSVSLSGTEQTEGGNR